MGKSERVRGGVCVATLQEARGSRQPGGGGARRRSPPSYFGARGRKTTRGGGGGGLGQASATVPGQFGYQVSAR